MPSYRCARAKEAQAQVARGWIVLQVEHHSLSSSSGRAEQSVPSRVYPYRAGLSGGALGGLAMTAVAMVYGSVNGRGIWLPINLIGATLVRDLQAAPLEALAQFNPAALLAGLVLHAALSIGLGLVFALLLPTLPGSPVFWSLTVGSLLWWLAGVLTLPLFNPIMSLAVDVPAFLVAHLAYGLMLGGWIARTPKIPAE